METISLKEHLQIVEGMKKQIDAYQNLMQHQRPTSQLHDESGISHMHILNGRQLNIQLETKTYFHEILVSHDNIILGKSQFPTLRVHHKNL